MDSSAMRHPSKTQPLKKGSGGITAWHGAKTLQAAKKPTPFLLTNRCIESVPVRQCFPVNGMWLCFRKECITRTKTLRMADNLGDRFRKETVWEFKGPIFSEEVNGHSVSVCVHNFPSVGHQKFHQIEGKRDGRRAEREENCSYNSW